MSEKGRKICKGLCDTCVYQMNISTGNGNLKCTGKFCGYSLIKHKCRTIDEKGNVIEGCKEYCKVYEKREGNKRTTRNISTTEMMKRPYVRANNGELIGVCGLDGRCNELKSMTKVTKAARR